jgi:2-dehydro-3-deoxy-D-gluconate 5-dehydrogenase
VSAVLSVKAVHSPSTVGWPQRFSLEGQVALVTGANKGIGQALAVALAQAGADVALVGRSDTGETAAAVQALGRRAHFVQADLQGVLPAQHAAKSVVQHFGRLDILVNNAGIIRRAAALDFTEADWDAVMDTNLKAAFFLSQSAARHMAKRGSGKLINICSMLSFQGGLRVASYTAAKSGLAGLTRLLANEWAPLGIQVNAIAPGYIATDNTAALQADAERNRQILERTPAGRWGRPDDLAGAVVFLASAASDFVNGHVLAVDGGWLAR